MILSVLALVVFAGLLLYAAGSDVASLTIPNWVSLALTGAFVVIGFASGMNVVTVGLHVLFGVGVLAIGFVLFQFGVFGGGDAKLMAGAAVWTGWATFTPFVLWMAIAGGVFALFLMITRRYSAAFAGAPPFVYRLLTPKTGVPYGVAIMIGGLMAAPSMPLFAGALTLP